MNRGWPEDNLADRLAWDANLSIQDVMNVPNGRAIFPNEFPLIGYFPGILPHQFKDKHRANGVYVHGTEHRG